MSSDYHTSMSHFFALKNDQKLRRETVGGSNILLYVLLLMGMSGVGKTSLLLTLSHLNSNRLHTKVCRGGGAGSGDCGERHAMWVDAGQHGAEWAGPAAAAYLLQVGATKATHLKKKKTQNNAHFVSLFTFFAYFNCSLQCLMLYVTLILLTLSRFFGGLVHYCAF